MGTRRYANMGKGAFGKGGEAVDPKVFIAVTMIASLIEMWAAAATCDELNNGFDDCKDEYALAVAIGCISLVVCIVVSIIYCVKADLMSGIGSTIVAAVLFILWGIGTGVCTFDIPFVSAVGENAANGYYSTWVAFITSTMFFMTIPQIKDLADKGTQGESGSLLFCFFGSIAEMWASAYMCDNYSSAYLGCGVGWTCKGGKCKYDTCTDLEGWGVTVGCVSAIVCLVFIILGIAKVDLNGICGGWLKKILAILLFIWWVLGVATLTFSYKDKDEKWDCKGAYGLFIGAGNGYFGTWLSFFSSFVFAYVSVLGKPKGGGDSKASASA